MPKPDVWNAAFTCVYDAWNRLVQVKDGNTVTASYKYNGLNQRIKKTTGTVVTRSTFNHNWQEIESKTGGVTTTYAGGLRYIDDLVCRDKGNERIYAIQDANWNVVAITDTNGVVKERISYDAFGKPGWLDVNHGPKTTSGYDWNRTFTGQVYDSETGLMLYRNRFYHSGLGRFVRRDPIGYDSDAHNLYRYVGNDPTNGLDKDGLFKIKIPFPGVVLTLTTSTWIYSCYCQWLNFVVNNKLAYPTESQATCINKAISFVNSWSRMAAARSDGSLLFEDRYFIWDQDPHSRANIACRQFTVMLPEAKCATCEQLVFLMANVIHENYHLDWGSNEDSANKYTVKILEKTKKSCERMVKEGFCKNIDECKKTIDNEIAREKDGNPGLWKK